VEQEQLRELEMTWGDGVVHPRWHCQVTAFEEVGASWFRLWDTLPELQQVSSLTLAFQPWSVDQPPPAEHPAAVMGQLVNLKALTMPVECVLGATGPAALPEGLTTLTLTLGNGVREALFTREDDPPLLVSALSAVSQADVPALKSVDFRPAWCDGAPGAPTQQRYDELQQGSKELPARIKVLWGGTPLQQVVPQAAAAAQGDSAEAAAAAAAGGEGAGAAAVAAGGGG
jgi:hypothetical protein